MDDKIAPLVDEIIRALDTTDITVDVNILQEELARLLKFKVPPDEAKRSLLKKYGFDKIFDVKKLSDLHGGERNIEITVRILNINLKVVGIKGQERTIFVGTMVDETAARNFTAWEDFGIKKGDTVKISNGYVRIWQGMPEINFGPRSKVEQLDPGTLDALMIKYPDKPICLAELETGMATVHTIFRIIDPIQKEITTKSGAMTLIHGIAADSTAKLPFTSWISNPELVKDNTIEIKNGYVRLWQGIPTINIGEYTTITRSDHPFSDDDISAILNPEPIKLGYIMDREGAFGVVVEGSIISIRPGSGLISRCPQCSRVILKNTCRVHGTVKSIDDLRIKSILDDGTGVLSIILDAELTEKITGHSIEKAKEIASSAVSPSAVEDDIKRILLDRTLRLSGNMTRGEYGIILVAVDAQMTNIDTADAASALIEEMTRSVHPFLHREDSI